LGSSASLNQALTLAAADANIFVSAGQYVGSYDLTKTVHLIGAVDDSSVPGAGAGAPELVNNHAGGTLFTITAVPNVSIQGFRFRAVTGGEAAIGSTAPNGLTVLNNTFDGFTQNGVSVLFGNGINIAFNAFRNYGVGTLATLLNVQTGGTVQIHDNVLLTDSTVSVSLQGSASGTVTSVPAGISCPSQCTATFPSGTPLVLMAAPSTGAQFDGWSGGCSGTAPCSVGLNGPLVVSAAFSPSIQAVAAPALPPSFVAALAALLALVPLRSGARRGRAGGGRVR
jgi:hypothetical protein